MSEVNGSEDQQATGGKLVEIESGRRPRISKATALKLANLPAMPKKKKPKPPHPCACGCGTPRLRRASFAYPVARVNGAFGERAHHVCASPRETERWPARR